MTSINNFIKHCRIRPFSHLIYSILYCHSYRVRAHKNGLKLKHLKTRSYVNKWRKLAVVWETTTYKYYAHYMKDLSKIVPESIGRTCIEYVLNPIKHRPYYSDKNMFGKILGKDNVAKTIICRVAGSCILNDDFLPLTDSEINDLLEKHESVLLKPTIDSKGGAGIMLFTRKDGLLRSGETILTKEMLLSYSDNFALQEIVKQHDRLSLLNPTSVNTLRIAVYKSVTDDKPHVIASIIRVGGTGMFVDNACMGGKYARVDVDSGRIDNSLRDSSGAIFYEQNGINYQDLEFVIPGWTIIKNKCIELAKSIIHHRLIAFDMTITNDMVPVLIEYNIESFSYWLFMYTNQSPLGEYTDEIINYCKDRLDNSSN